MGTHSIRPQVRAANDTSQWTRKHSDHQHAEWLCIHSSREAQRVLQKWRADTFKLVTVRACALQQSLLACMSDPRAWRAIQPHTHAFLHYRPGMCTNNKADVLNAIHLPEGSDDKTVVLTLQYGPFMN